MARTRARKWERDFFWRDHYHLFFFSYLCFIPVNEDEMARELFFFSFFRFGVKALLLWRWVGRGSSWVKCVQICRRGFVARSRRRCFLWTPFDCWWLYCVRQDPSFSICRSGDCGCVQCGVGSALWGRNIGEERGREVVFSFLHERYFYPTVGMRDLTGKARISKAADK